MGSSASATARATGEIRSDFLLPVSVLSTAVKTPCPGMPQDGFQFLRLSADYSPTGNHDVTQSLASATLVNVYITVFLHENQSVESLGAALPSGGRGSTIISLPPCAVTDGYICNHIFSGSRGNTELSSSYLSLIMWEDLLVLCFPSLLGHRI